MIAEKTEVIPLLDGELAELIRTVGYVDCAFGPGWVAIKLTKGKEMQPAVEALARMRGVLDENKGGDGI